MSGFVEVFKVKKGNNKLMSFSTEEEKLLEKYEAIQTNIGDLKNIKLKTLRVYDHRYIKTKIIKFGDQIYTNFCG